MNRKGVLGITTTKTIILALLILTILAIVTVLTVVTMRDVYEASETKTGNSVYNETLTSVTEAGKTLVYNRTSRRLTDCTIVRILNATNVTHEIPSTNYTTTASLGNCQIKSAALGIFNNTNWNVTYTWVANSPEANEITSNLSGGMGKFFKQTPVFFTLMAVIVLILIIAIVIVAVSRFGEGGEGGGAGGGIGIGGGSNKGYVEEL